MGYISYPRTSGGSLNDRERDAIRESITQKQHLAPGKNELPRIIHGQKFSSRALEGLNNTTISPEQAISILKTGISYTSSSGATVYYDSINNVSIVVGISGSIIGIYPGRISGKLDTEQLLKKQQEQKQKQLKEVREARLKEEENTDPIPQPQLGDTPSTSNSTYATLEDQQIRGKSTAGIANLECAVEFQKTYPQATDNFLPPYMPGTPVERVTLQKDQVFVRLYSNDKKIESSWVMLKEDYDTYSWVELCDRYSIPPENKPNKVCEVLLEKGTRLRRGTANSDANNGLLGGGLQFEIIKEQFKDGKYPEGAFRAIRKNE